MRSELVFISIHNQCAAGRCQMSQTTHAVPINAPRSRAPMSLERKLITASLGLGVVLVGLLYLVSHVGL